MAQIRGFGRHTCKDACGFPVRDCTLILSVVAAVCLHQRVLCFSLTFLFWQVDAEHVHDVDEMEITRHAKNTPPVKLKTEKRERADSIESTKVSPVSVKRERADSDDDEPFWTWRRQEDTEEEEGREAAENEMPYIDLAGEDGDAEQEEEEREGPDVVVPLHERLPSLFFHILSVFSAAYPRRE